MTTYGLTNGKTVLVSYCWTHLWLSVSLKIWIFLIFFKFGLTSDPVFQKIDLFGFMAPFGSSLKMILVVLSSLFHLETNLIWKQTATPWCKDQVQQIFLPYARFGLICPFVEKWRQVRNWFLSCATVKFIEYHSVYSNES